MMFSCVGVELVICTKAWRFGDEHLLHHGQAAWRQVLFGR